MNGERFTADVFLPAQGATVEADPAFVGGIAVVLIHQRQAMGASHAESPVVAALEL